MTEINKPQRLQASAKPILIVIYSPNKKFLQIVTHGLMQSNFKVIASDSINLTLLKVNQYQPNLLFIDLANNHLNLTILPDLKKLRRGLSTKMALIGNDRMAYLWSKLMENTDDLSLAQFYANIGFLIFPFKFAQLLDFIKERVNVSLLPTRQIEEKHIAPENVETQVLDTNVHVDVKLQRIYDLFKEHWAFPITIIKAMNIAKSDKNGCRDLAKCIETDSATTSAVLKIANRVFYAKAVGEITNATEAIVRLGFRETRNILSSLALMDMTYDVHNRHGFSRNDFWLHSLSTAIIAEKLCKMSGVATPEIGFITGLLHDLGKIPLDNNFKIIFPDILEKCTSRIIPFYVAEIKTLGFDHAQLAHYLAIKWNIPPLIASGILNHHNPAQIMESTSEVERKVQSAVYTANVLSKCLNLGHSCDEFIPEIPSAMLSLLSIPKGPSQQMIQDSIRDIRELCGYLQFTKKELEIGDLQADSQKEQITVELERVNTFHPLLLALKNAGYQLNIVKDAASLSQKDSNVSISIPTRGKALDFDLDDDAITDTVPDASLKIFLVDEAVNWDESAKEKETDTQILFYPRSNVNFRVIQRRITNHLEKAAISKVAESQKGWANK